MTGNFKSRERCRKAFWCTSVTTGARDDESRRVVVNVRAVLEQCGTQSAVLAASQWRKASDGDVVLGDDTQARSMDGVNFGVVGPLPRGCTRKPMQWPVRDRDAASPRVSTEVMFAELGA